MLALFNFSSSYAGGGLKRLVAFAQWFNDYGGAYFIVNSRAKKYLSKYERNVFYYIDPSKAQKFLNKQNYLFGILNQLPSSPDLYYSYGIPIPFKVGQVNWFHLSNVLPLINHSGYGLSLFRSIELKWLGKLFKKSYKNAEVLSAESNYSLDLLPSSSRYLRVVSPNGSDEEIELFSQSIDHKINDIAVVVGTFFYKDLEGSYKVFRKLKKECKELRMAVVGIPLMVPSKIINDKSVDIVGEISHKDVIILLSSAKFYINTTKVENSWNAASEGVVLANESYISSIEPHVELVKIIANNNHVLGGDLIHVKRKNISVEKLMTWSDIIQDMNKLVEGYDDL